MTDFTRRGFIATLAGVPILGKLLSSPKVEPKNALGPACPALTSRLERSIVRAPGWFDTWIIQNPSKKTIYIARPDVVADSSTGLALAPKHTLTIQADPRKCQSQPLWSVSARGLIASNLNTGEHFLL